MCDFCNHTVRSPNYQEMSHAGPVMSTAKAELAAPLMPMLEFERLRRFHRN